MPPEYFFFVLASLVAPPRSAHGTIYDNVPPTIDPAAHYLFHMHGRAIEVQGPHAKPSWGTYLYKDVLQAFEERS